MKENNFYISNLKFRNPIHAYALKLPKKNITI